MKCLKAKVWRLLEQQTSVPETYLFILSKQRKKMLFRIFFFKSGFLNSLFYLFTFFIRFIKDLMMSHICHKNSGTSSICVSNISACAETFCEKNCSQIIGAFGLNGVERKACRSSCDCCRCDIWWRIRGWRTRKQKDKPPHLNATLTAFTAP